MLPTQPVNVTACAAFLADGAGCRRGEVCADAVEALSRAIPLRSVIVFMLLRNCKRPATPSEVKGLKQTELG